MKKLIGRILIVAPSVALQVAWYVLLFSLINKGLEGYLGDILTVVFTILSVFFVLYLVSKREEGSYKLVWVICIMALPILGSMLFLLLGDKKTGRNLNRELKRSSEALIEEHHDRIFEWMNHEENVRAIKEEDLRVGQTLSHLSDLTGFPLLKNSETRYYPFGENMFPDMCEDLRNAERFIYVEYFIIQSGKFWDTITDILKQKAAEGLDVRVMYDDFGSISTYSVKDIKHLKDKGIRCIAFNPFLFLRSQLNNRDHRKIMVIDGTVAYSGGVNLADEYINEIERFGVWKDLGFRVTGAAALSYTYMFTEFWNAFSFQEIPKEILIPIQGMQSFESDGNGYVLPYYDSPMREEAASNTLFVEVLSMATGYVWFYTPYLMLGDELLSAFVRAAQRGVDVRIILPGIPDKKLVYRIARSYYNELLKAGVKIYEYTPGFVHAKGFVSDDKIAGIGTVNLDYRSLFLNFECYSVFYKADITEKIKTDFLACQAECRERTYNDVKKSVLSRLLDSILRLAAPLL